DPSRGPWPHRGNLCPRVQQPSKDRGTWVSTRWSVSRGARRNALRRPRKPANTAKSSAPEPPGAAPVAQPHAPGSSTTGSPESSDGTTPSPGTTEATHAVDAADVPVLTSTTNTRPPASSAS